MTWLVFVSELKELYDDSQQVAVKAPQTARGWAPIDMHNKDYLQYLEEQKNLTEKHDYIKQNIVSYLWSTLKYMHTDVATP